ncbi:Phage tail-collar fibre protein [Ralstonia sp. 25mfcol4.1]|uniref:phage tail-collar fiber domain-containing protein n=1 Tax=Burkholderiaceae TaxID=119060 RepID=UPI0008822653|nr:phage tail protein [Ralstonia sp. 25mfcol4.1]SDO94205.1 Phage tail-collar fibre protein [Ralstonia sp. 25mfcol4.1]
MTQRYFLMPTAAGEARIANAQALGKPFRLTHMAVGDGNGALPEPSRQRSALVNEKRRAPLNMLSPDPDNPGQYIAEQVIPAEVGGWWMREAGLYDEDGMLCYYSNLPETYKPRLAEGSGRTQVIRLVVLVTGQVKVELKIDASAVLATREYVDNRFGACTAASLPAVLGTAAGVGADLAVTNAAAGDLNALVTPGEYFYSSANPNAPSDAGVMKVWREDSQWVSQLCQSRSGELFVRTRNADGAWSPWRWNATLPSDRAAYAAVGVTVEVGIANELRTPQIQLARGVYVIAPYNCGFEIENSHGSYYLTCFAQFDAGIGESGFTNVPQVNPSPYNQSPFVVRVFSAMATVRFVLKNNGSIPSGHGTVRIRGGNYNAFAFYGNKVL